MKIAHINLAKGYRGGERQTQLLIEALHASIDIEQRLIGARGGDLAQRIKLPASAIHEVGRPYVLHSGAVKGVDLLHVHEGKAGHYALMANLRLGIPYIITRRVPNRPKDNFFTRQVYQRATRIVAISHAIKDYMLDYDASLNVEVIPSMVSPLAVDEQQVQLLRKQFAGKFVIGHIGALVNHHKGQRYIIEAAKRLQQTHPQLHFVLLGDGKDEAWLKEMAAGLSNITFTGFVNNVGDYLSIFDLFVFPSLEEGLGSILLDVMNFSKAIIASNVDGIPDIVQHEENGLLIPPKNSDTLHDAIIRLYASENERQQLAEAGNAFVQNYSPAKLSKRYTSLYQELLS